MSTYEIGVYNQIIRTAIRRGEKVNPLMNISPEFEEVIYFQRVADSKADAIASINREYPLARGYIIDFCIKFSDA
jgi:hypothetical protein